LALSANLRDDGDAAFPRNAESAIRALIVSEVRLYRDGIAEILQRQETVRLLATAADLHDALAEARSLSPDVILVDMTRLDAMHALQALAREVPEARILALGVPEAEKNVVACVEAGATGCVTPDASLEQVLLAVESIIRGEAPCPARRTPATFKRVSELTGQPENLDERLTPREREIVTLIDEGLSNKKIAQKLCVETATVKNHVHSILKKLQVSSRGEAAAAIRHGSGARRALESVVAPILWHVQDESLGLVLSSPWS
jgi:DNA-binding NarL/FixJ family response regulator